MERFLKYSVETKCRIVPAFYYLLCKERGGEETRMRSERGEKAQPLRGEKARPLRRALSACARDGHPRSLV